MNVSPENLLSLPVGNQLADGNWESFVHELGDEWVYKEIRTEHCFLPNVAEGTLAERIVLQRFWCSDTHFENVIKDNKIISENLSKWIPEAYILKAPAKFSDNPAAIITVQKKINGKLLAERPDFTSESLFNLRRTALELCKKIKAPLDFHTNNIIIENDSDEVFLVDTGTPSDWEYFLNPLKMQEAIEISHQEAVDFVQFMIPHYKSHSKLSGMKA